MSAPNQTTGRRPRKGLWPALAVVGLGAVLVLIAARGSSLDYYRDVDALLSSGVPLQQGRPVRVKGTVVPGSVRHDLSSGETRFLLGGKSRQLEVTFTGALPPLFAPGREVVVTGRLQPGGRFQAYEVLTKCPSKYEARRDDP